MVKKGQAVKSAGKSAGKGVGGRGGKAVTGKIRYSKSLRAGLTFPVTRVRRHLKAGRYAERIGQGAAIYMG